MSVNPDLIKREMRQGFDRVMTKLERDFAHGNEASLLVAVELCLMHAASWGTAPPEWVVKAYSERLWRFMSHKTATLDDAFGLAPGNHRE